MSIKYKLIISYVLLIIFSVSILGFFIGSKSQDTIFSEVTEKSERIAELIYSTVSVRNDLLSEKVWTDLQFAKKLLNSSGEIRVDNTNSVNFKDFSIPNVYAGSTNLTLDNTLVDDISETVGAIASVMLYQDGKLIRISTNLSSNGTKAIGTFINNDSDIYKKILNNEPYYGRFFFQGDWFITGYEPIYDSNNNIIGAIALGYKIMNSYLENTLNNIKIGQTGYVYVMNTEGSLFVHPQIKGKNLGHYDFSKEIVTNKNGTIEYKFNGINKLAVYRYFEPWDWYIIATANYDDLNSTSRSVIKTTLLTGLTVLIIGIFLALLMSVTLVKPINKLKKYMEIAGKGDLTVHSDISSNDEIGTLSNSFNNMIYENKRLLEETIKYDKLKTDFFSNISHELKTPLNIIFSTTQLISIYANNDSQAIDNTKLNRHINIIKQNGYRLLKLVNNLIDITRIDSGFMQLNLQNKDIVQVIENITSSTVEYVESKARSITFDTNLEEKIMACDVEKLERIMLNLISNAVKFTKPGDKIEVSVNVKSENVLISVKDTGRGIPEDKHEEIFERFKQVDSLLCRSHEGSGIGLSLVKSLVEMHGGIISVKSKYGEGSEFIIELPVTIVAEEGIKPVDYFSYQSNIEKIQIEFSDIYS